MPDYTIYALKIDEGNASRVFASLGCGEARFGWSYAKTADLRELRRRVEREGWAALSESEQDCYQRFLLDIRPNDYLIYINVPKWGECTCARVTQPYSWRGTDGDFNHQLGVDPSTMRSFDRNDPRVHPALSARLKLQGRWWRVYARPEFEELLDALGDKGAVEPLASGTPNLRFLTRDIQPLLLRITELIQHTHPNYSLEEFMAEVLTSVPGVKEVRRQGGAGDQGADILAIVEHGHPLTGGLQQTTCVVQVKSFTGEHWDTRAVNDISRAFKAYPEAEAGLIISTASKSGASLETALDKLKAETGRHVGLLIGEEVALFVLRHGSHLFETATP